jgi:tellurite methyltransferase
MQRPINGYHLDPAGDWVAELSCGHGQHVRHQPPFTIREWAITPEGRASRLGQLLDCPWCDRRQIPNGHVVYRQTPVFSDATIPTGLRSQHSTKAGVWGRLQVQSGTLAFIVEGPPEARQLLAAGESVVIVPELRHRVDVLGPVEFFVEFLRAAPSE